MNAAAIKLRPAKPSDCHAIFAWANDPDTRSASFHTETIALEEHESWFATAIAEPDSLFIIEAGDEPAGVARIEATENNNAEISINLAPEARGRGLAWAAIMALISLAGHQGYGQLLARIRADNPRSQRVFEKSGFIHESTETVNGTSALIFARDTTDSDIP